MISEKFKKQSMLNINGEGDFIENNYEIANAQFSMLKSLSEVNVKAIEREVKKLEKEKKLALYPRTEIVDAEKYAKNILEIQKKLNIAENDLSNAKKTKEFYSELLEAIND